MKPTLTRFRKRYEQLTIPLGHVCHRLGLTPDILTLISLCMGALSAYAVARAIEETERTRLVAKAIAHLLIEKGILTLDELQARIEKMKSGKPGAAV